MTPEQLLKASGAARSLLFAQAKLSQLGAPDLQLADIWNDYMNTSDEFQTRLLQATLDCFKQYYESKIIEAREILLEVGVDPDGKWPHRGE